MLVHIVAIHGIGHGRQPGFSWPLRDLVVQELERMRSSSASRAKEGGDHFWREVLWDQDEVAAELYQKVGDPLPGWVRRLLRCLGLLTPRQLACYDVGDILAYYARRRQVLDKIRREVERIVEEHGEKGTRELYLALVGHSMGSVVAFDFLHESQREPGPHVAWRGADTRPSVIVAQEVAGKEVKVFASGLFTLGSPLALFYRLSSAGEDHQYRDREPFRLEDGWRNYWDKEDLVSFNLEGIFGKKVVQDVAVDNSRLPLWGLVRAHGGYWRNARVARDIAEHVHRMENRPGDARATMSDSEPDGGKGA
jgi:hypothetical protein